MEFWDKYIPNYLTDKGNIVRTVLFTAAFALLFINIYAPFGVNAWFDVTSVQLFFYSSIVILTGVMIVVVSRVIMYHSSRNNKLRYWHYSLWIFLEIVCMALIYVVIEMVVLNDPRSFISAFKISLQNTALIILLPYVVLWLYFSWRDKNQKLNELIEMNNQPEKSRKMISFYDERGVLKFSVLEEKVYYLEAADNYVTIYYHDKEKISNYLLRSTLKKMEESMVAPFFRCHRSFIVNADKVKFIKKEKDGLFIDLGIDKIRQIPLSRTYAENFLKVF